MARKPSVKASNDITSLMDFALAELDAAITRPNILSYKPYQEQEDFHRCPLTGRYLSAGNRAGKTTAEVIEAIWLGTDTHPFQERPAHWGHGAIRMRFVVVDIDKGVHGIILPELKRWCATSMLINGSFDDSWNNSTLTFTFANGSTIQFLTHGMELDKHGGVPMHAIFFDEIPPLSVFNENMMRLIDYNGVWILAATSVDGLGWTYELLWEPAKEGKNPDIGTFELSQDKNPFLKTSVKDRDKFYIGMDEAEVAVRRQGSFVPRSGRVFPSWNVHDHVLPEHVALPRGWRAYTSTDFGWSNPTAWLWHAVAPDGRVYTFDEHYQTKMPVPQHAEVVLAKEAFHHLNPADVIRVGDPNNGDAKVINGISYVSEYANHGIYIATENIPRGVGIGIEKMQQYIRLEPSNGWGKNKPRWMISPRCVNLIREMKKLRWADYDSAKKSFDSNKREEVHKKDDHAFDSSRYFFTFMPELAPTIDEIIEQQASQGLHLNYEQTMRMLREDDRVAFESDREWSHEYVDEFEEV